jgi:isoquinoline 1-oxidoreductase beta subunit
MATAQGMAPEVNAWVVVQPDERVVIRIARSEMGQGTLTGLAQLVAEELECDWARVTTEYPTPGQNLARNRVWGNFSTGGSRGIRESHDYVRKGGAAARMMLVQAAADELEGASGRVQRREGVITHAQRPQAPATARWPPPPQAASRRPKVPLKDPKDWKLAGKRHGAAGHGRQDHRQADLRRRPAAARHAQRRDPGLPGLRRQGQELRRRGGDRHARREEGGAVGDNAVAVVADTWWRAKKALDACRSTGTWARTPSVSSAGVRRHAEGRPGRPEAVVGNSNGDAQGSALAGARARSRRSTPTRTRTTPRWSR